MYLLKTIIDMEVNFDSLLGLSITKVDAPEFFALDGYAFNGPYETFDEAMVTCKMSSKGKGVKIVQKATFSNGKVYPITRYIIRKIYHVVEDPESKSYKGKLVKTPWNEQLFFRNPHDYIKTNLFSGSRDVFMPTPDMVKFISEEEFEELINKELYRLTFSMDRDQRKANEENYGRIKAIRQECIAKQARSTQSAKDTWVL